MKATLTLDDDVAALLDRARREQGRSLEETGNELLRRILRRLGLSPAQYPESEAPRSEAAARSDQGPPDAVELEAAVDQLYDELRDLVARSAEDPGLSAEIDRKREQLHVLQVEEAEAWRLRAEARRHLKPGEGYQLLEQAERLLER